MGDNRSLWLSQSILVIGSADGRRPRGAGHRAKPGIW